MIHSDFTWWSGLAAGEVRTAIAGAAPCLARETIGGETFWMPADAPSAVRAAAAAARRCRHLRRPAGDAGAHR